MLPARHAVLTAAIILAASAAYAVHYCEHCGCHRNCKKICRLECGKKKETKIEYSSECEDFCVPGPSRKCGVKVECDSNGHRHRTIIWQPTCAKVHTRKTLVKKEVTKEVPDYKWVVEEYCGVCGQLIKVDGRDKSNDGGSGNSPYGDKKAHRFPIRVAATEHAAGAGDGSDGDYGDYFVGSQPRGTDIGNVPSSLTTEREVGEASLDEQSPEHLPAEPRRLFSGLFGR